MNNKCKHEYNIIDTFEINGLTDVYPVHKIKCRKCGKECLVLVDVWNNMNKER